MENGLKQSPYQVHRRHFLFVHVKVKTSRKKILPRGLVQFLLSFGQNCKKNSHKKGELQILYNILIYENNMPSLWSANEVERSRDREIISLAAFACLFRLLFHQVKQEPKKASVLAG